VKNITVVELNEALKVKGEIAIIDVREKWELDIGKIKNSIELPISSLGDSYKTLEIEKDYAVICHSGVRSMQACGFLSSCGYQVRNVLGGIDEWSVKVDSKIDRY